MRTPLRCQPAATQAPRAHHPRAATRSRRPPAPADTRDAGPLRHLRSPHRDTQGTTTTAACPGLMHTPPHLPLPIFRAGCSGEPTAPPQGTAVRRGRARQRSRPPAGDSDAAGPSGSLPGPPVGMRLAAGVSRPSVAVKGPHYGSGRPSRSELSAVGWSRALRQGTAWATAREAHGPTPRDGRGESYSRVAKSQGVIARNCGIECRGMRQKLERGKIGARGPPLEGAGGRRGRWSDPGG